MTYQRQYFMLLTAVLCLSTSMTGFTQSKSSAEASSATGYEVTQIVGLPDAKPDIRGQLTMSDTDLLFQNPEFHAEIPFSRMTSVSIGNVRIETGGKTGLIARKVIPYGGGMALAGITQKSVDLITVEFLDLQGGYHGAVFYVPKSSAKEFKDSIATHLLAIAPGKPLACEAGPSVPNSVLVEPIETSGVGMPAEYRVLLYERLMNELRDSTFGSAYVRAGSFYAGEGCSAMKLKITVTGFNKGNQALRASTGPIGFFVGKTSMSFHLELTTADGRSVLAENMSNSKRMDTESLGVAKSVAKSISKKIRKLRAKQLAANIGPNNI